MRIRGQTPPEFHHEVLTFPTEKIFNHLSPVEGEIEIVRCVNVVPPAGWKPTAMDVYLCVQLDINKGGGGPDDDFKAKTASVKGTVSPAFDR